MMNMVANLVKQKLWSSVMVSFKAESSFFRLFTLFFSCFFACIAPWHSLCSHPLQLLVLVCTDDEAVQNAGELCGVGSSDSWIVDIVTDVESERMFMSSSPESDGPAKTVGICVSSETASYSAPWSKDVVLSGFGSNFISSWIQSDRGSGWRRLFLFMWRIHVSHSFMF